MKFEIDNQTLTDLNIFGTSTNEKSVFSLFDETLCMGGKKKLSTFFHSPMADNQMIEERLKAIQFLEKQLSGGMNLDKNALDFAEYYFRHANFVAELPTVTHTVKKFIGKLNSSDKYHLIDRGVLSMAKLIKSLHSFAKILKEKSEIAICPALVKDNVDDILDRLDSEDFSLLFEKEIYSAKEIARMDYVFRKTSRQDISKFLDFIYEFDAYTTVATVSKTLGLSYPEITDIEDKSLQIEGLFHPLIHKPVDCNVTIKGESKLLFITGPNMAGKSTFLKALGISAYLAHIGFPVPAKKMRISILSGISTSINLADDLNLGYSHFYAEVKRIGEVTETLKTHPNMLVIFDELFRGTNVKDAYDGTLAIASAFSGIKSSFFVISSHIVEVAEKLKDEAGVRFGYFQVNQEDARPVYTYQLKEGISDVRLGMYIINKEGLLARIKELEN